MQEKRIQDDRVRQRLFLLRLGKNIGVQQACLRLGKHRSYFYYWKARYESLGWQGLVEQSRRPKCSPRQSSAAVEARVVAYRQKTFYGKERLAPLVGVPASTVGHILRRHGLLVKKRRWKTEKKHQRRYNLLWPGQRFQMDVKYLPFKIKGKQYYQYTVIDECSRLRYLEIHEALWTLTTVDVLKRAQAYFSFPVRCVQTDNGTEFTFRYTAELQAKNKEAKEHPLDRYCRTQKIEHRCIPPGEKELNGKVERSHRIDDEEFYRHFKSKPNFQELRSKLKQWLNFYNTLRPHSALQGKTPLQFAQERLRLKNKHQRLLKLKDVVPK